MFETQKTLIVVYKDELLMNQLKKLIETRDDDGDTVIGTKDDSINIVSWEEKVWLSNKKAGNIKGKILFLGDVRGTEKLIPVLDVQFDDCGVKYGWAGNQAVLFVDPKALITKDAYEVFLQKLADLPVPAFLKKDKDKIAENGIEIEKEEPATDMTATEETIPEPVEENESKKNHNTPAFLDAVRKGFESGSEAIGKMGKDIASKTEQLFRDKALMKRQMLFYGVVSLYNKDLDKFMRS